MECYKCLLDNSVSKMHYLDGKWFCEECYSLLLNPLNYEKMQYEFEMYVEQIKEKNKEKKYDVLFALSGGKDSIAALYFTIEKYNLRPLAFTVDHGYKNQTIWDNCRTVVEHYNLDWFILKIDSPTVKKIGCLSKEGDLPCCHCNKLWKGRYFAKAISMTGITDLFIGGDTLEKHTAIIARPDYQTDTVGLPLPLNIKTEKDIYEVAYSLGWKDPQTKGWDTDCIAVGMALRKYRSDSGRVHVEEVKHLSHRVRYGILEKEEAKNMLMRPIVVTEALEREFLNAIED